MTNADGWNTRFCAACGKRSRCYDSRDEGPLIIRHRECPDCKVRWKTVEISAARYNMMKTAERRVREEENCEW